MRASVTRCLDHVPYSTLLAVSRQAPSSCWVLMQRSGNAVGGPKSGLIGNLSCAATLQVSERIKGLFCTLEAAHKGRTIVLVSHGDTLSILWATVKGLPLKEHRTHGLSTGELRLLHSC